MPFHNRLISPKESNIRERVEGESERAREGGCLINRFQLSFGTDTTSWWVSGSIFFCPPEDSQASLPGAFGIKEARIDGGHKAIRRQ